MGEWTSTFTIGVSRYCASPKIPINLLYRGGGKSQLPDFNISTSDMKTICALVFRKSFSSVTPPVNVKELLQIYGESFILPNLFQFLHPTEIQQTSNQPTQHHLRYDKLHKIHLLQLRSFL